MLDSLAICEMDGSRIFGCSVGKRGGGVFLRATSHLIMRGASVIDSCSAQAYGGGLQASSSDVLVSEASVIVNCFAEIQGGGLQLESSRAILSQGSRVEACTTAGNGGGAFARQSSEINLISGSSIRGCAAFEGGGVGIGAVVRERARMPKGATTAGYS